MKSIYVGNLSYNATEADVTSLCERHGEVSSVQVMTDRVTGRPRGFAFVRMRSIDDAEEVIARLNGSTFQGRKLVVNQAQEREHRPHSTGENRWHLV